MDPWVSYGALKLMIYSFCQDFKVFEPTAMVVVEQHLQVSLSEPSVRQSALGFVKLKLIEGLNDKNI